MADKLRLVLRPEPGRAGRRPQAAGWIVRVRMDGIGELLPAQRQQPALSLWRPRAADVSFPTPDLPRSILG